MSRSTLLLTLLLAMFVPSLATAQSIVPGLGQQNQGSNALPSTQLEKNRQDGDSAALVGSIVGGASGLIAGYAINRIVCEAGDSEMCARSLFITLGMTIAGAPAGGLIGRSLARNSQTERAEYRPIWEGLGIGLGVGIASLIVVPNSSDPILPILLLTVPTAGGALLGYINPMEGNANNFSLAPTFDRDGRVGLSLQGNF